MTIALFPVEAPLGRLTINTLDMHGYAWCVQDIRSLFIPQSYRGTNLVMPGASGRRSNRIRIDEAVRELPMFFTGHLDLDGDPYEDPLEGFHTNLAIIRETLLVPSSGATVPATITETPDGVDWAADVQVIGFGFMDHWPDYEEASLTLRIPQGRFVEVGS